MRNANPVLLRREEIPCRFIDEKFSKGNSTNWQLNQNPASQKQMRTSLRFRANQLQNQKLLLLSAMVRNPTHTSRQNQVILLVRIAKLDHSPPLQNLTHLHHVSKQIGISLTGACLIQVSKYLLPNRATSYPFSFSICAIAR
jgi:hypothetical protein